ncbi:MAG: peptidase [Pirellulales bacterium]|nr:peptidase [Pirellulales bacterium]
MSPTTRWRRSAPWILAWLLASSLGSVAAAAEIELKMKDGRVLQGILGQTSGVAEQPLPPGKGPLQLILFVDDQLRRTFVPKRLRREIRYPKHVAPLKPFKISQRAKHFGNELASAGLIIRMEPFDEYGRRIITMQGRNGPVDIVQGITELRPKWVKIEAITPMVWEMRVATSSLPTDVLAKILNKLRVPDSVEHQKRIARFYIEMERYEDAEKVLETFLEKHTDDAAMCAQIEPLLRQVRQLGAQRLVNELKRRRDVGQYQLVSNALRKFPSKDVAGEILQEVRELLRQSEADEKQRQQIVDTFNELVARLKDAGLRARIEPVAKELDKELSRDTLGRMAAFRLAMADEDMLPAERLALGVGGWLLGSNTAMPNLPNALSAYEVRNLLAEYLVEKSQAKRDELLETLGSQEASAPRTVAQLLEHMRPPVVSEPVEGRSGYYELEVAGRDKDSTIRYLVQTPPEYNPYRLYPTVVTLHGLGTTPEQQVDWWAGAPDKNGRRNGQAGRNGYIVIAPQWTIEAQQRYLYSAREHAAVLNALRDAMQRFSIDTDRVYLSGHSAGGDAAWDLGLAHPDLWAGVIPILANARRYCLHYWKNAKYVPFYFVGGEKDGAWLYNNASEFDRYLKRGFDTTVVEFLGRGREHYYDEVLRIFDWMGRFKRNFYPREFTCDSMRPWDNFFWWVEVEGMPEKSSVEPGNWPPPRGTRPMETNAALLPSNGIRIRSGASGVTVWLSPKMVDFEQRVNITVDGREINRADPFIKPDLATMLEDARTRADRLHPFWAKMTTSLSRVYRDR